MTLFNCCVGSFCDILLAFSASPHHIKLTYPRINCLNTHFLSDNCRQNYFDFPKKQDCGSDWRVVSRASRPGSRQGGFRLQAALLAVSLFEERDNCAGFLQAHSQCAAHSYQAPSTGWSLWLHAQWLKGDKANNCTEVCLERNYLLIIPGCLALTWSHDQYSLNWSHSAAI